MTPDTVVAAEYGSCAAGVSTEDSDQLADAIRDADLAEGPDRVGINETLHEIYIIGWASRPEFSLAPTEVSA